MWVLSTSFHVKFEENTHKKPILCQDHTIAYHNEHYIFIQTIVNVGSLSKDIFAMLGDNVFIHSSSGSWS